MYSRNSRCSEERYLREVFRTEIHHAAALTKAKGVMLGISKQLSWICISEELDSNSRYIILNGKLGSRTLMIVGVYYPNVGQSAFWDILRNKLLNFDKYDLVILGDFNAVLNKELNHSRITLTPEVPLSL